MSNRKNAATAEGRDKVILAYSLLTPIAETMECPIWTLGTPWAFTDLSNHLKEVIRVPTFRRSVLDGRAPLGREKEEPPIFLVGEEKEEHRGWPLDPAILDEDGIRRLCTPGQEDYIGYEQFYANYLCQPTAGEDQMFNLDVWNGSMEPALAPSVGKDEHGLLDLGYEVVFVDPAAKADGKGCKTGIMVYRILTAKELGYHGFPDLVNVYVPVEACEVASGAARLVKELLRIRAERKKVRYGAIEDAALVDMVLPWMVEDIGMPMKPIRVKSQSKYRRLMGLQLAMLQGRWKRPPSFPGDGLLRDYLIRYPLVDSMDLLDAAALVSLLPRKGRADDVLGEPPAQGTVAWHDAYAQMNTPRSRRHR